MASDKQLYYQQQQNYDSQKLINVLVMFIGYVLFIVLFLVLGIIDKISSAGLIVFGGILMFAIFRYNEVNDQTQRDRDQILLDEIEKLKKEKEDTDNETDDESESGEITGQDLGELHSHGNIEHRHPANFGHEGNIITSSDSDRYGICEDGDTLHKKYLQRYSLLNFGSDDFNIPEDTDIKKIKITFKPHKMNNTYEHGNPDSFLSSKVTGGNPGSSTNTNPGIVEEEPQDSAYRADIPNLACISLVQIIEQTVGKNSTVDGQYDTDGLTDIAPKAGISVMSNTTEVMANSASQVNLINGGQHVNALKVIDPNEESRLDSFYFGGMRLSTDTVGQYDEDAIVFTLNVAKNRNDLASMVIYTPIPGALRSSYLHLLNGNDQPVTAEPIPFPSGNFHIYEFKFGALGGRQIINDTLTKANKADIYHLVTESVHSRVVETRREYAETHFRSNPNNVYDCSDPEETSEGFVTKLNETMYGAVTDITDQFKSKTNAVSNELLK